MKSRRGFSLLELIVAMAVVVLLAGVLVPIVRRSIVDAKAARVLTLVKNLREAARKYYYDTDQLPIETDFGPSPTHDLFVKPAGLNTWKGPYIDKPLGLSSNFVEGKISLRNQLTGEIVANDGFYIGGDNLTWDGSQFSIHNIPTEIAQAIDLSIDGTVKPTEGACESSMNADLLSADFTIFLFRR